MRVPDYDAMESYESRRQERREEERRYEADVYYDVWRSGGNPDAVNPDRVADAFHEGTYHEDAAAREIRKQRPAREPEQQEQEP